MSGDAYESKGVSGKRTFIIALVIAALSIFGSTLMFGVAKLGFTWGTTNNGDFVTPPVTLGQVGWVDPGPAAFAVDVVLHPFQFLFPARHQAQPGAARGQLFGRFLADAAGGTGEHDGHTLKAHRTSSR